MKYILLLLYLYNTNLFANELNNKGKKMDTELEHIILNYQMQNIQTKDDFDTKIDIMYLAVDYMAKQFQTKKGDYTQIAKDISFIKEKNMIFDRFYLLSRLIYKSDIDFLLTQFDFFDDSLLNIKKDLQYTNWDWTQLYEVGFDTNEASFEELTYEIMNQRMSLIAEIAIRFNDLELLKKATSSKNFTHNAQKLFNFTRLNPEIKELLLKANIDFTKKNFKIETYKNRKTVKEIEGSALYGAINLNRVDLVKEFIKRGSDVNWRYASTKFIYKREPFINENLALSETYNLDDHMQQAIRAGNYEIAKILIDNGFKFDVGNGDRVNYLAMLIEWHNYQYMHYGKMLNNQDPENYPKLVKLLLNSGEKLEVRSIKELIKDKKYPPFFLDYFNLKELSQEDWNDIFSEMSRSNDISILEYLKKTNRLEYLKKIQINYYSYNQKLEKFLVENHLIDLATIHKRTLSNVMYYVEAEREPNNTLKSDFLVDYLFSADYIEIAYEEEGRSFLSFFAAVSSIPASKLEAFLKKLQEQNKLEQLINLKTLGGGITLFWSQKDPEKIKLLIAYGANPHLKDDEGRTIASYVNTKEAYDAVRVYATDTEKNKQDCYFYVGMDYNIKYQDACKKYAKNLSESPHKVFTLFIAGEFKKLTTIKDIDDNKSHLWIAFAYALTNDISNATKHYDVYKKSFDKNYFEQSLERVEKLYGKEKKEMIEKVIAMQDTQRVDKLNTSSLENEITNFSTRRLKK